MISMSSSAVFWRIAELSFRISKAVCTPPFQWTTKFSLSSAASSTTTTSSTMVRMILFFGSTGTANWRSPATPRIQAGGGNTVRNAYALAVRDGDRQWDAESGQLLMDFEVKPTRGQVQVLAEPSPAVTPPAGPSEPVDAGANARAAFELGVSLESTAPVEAEQAYREAIRLAPDWLDPYLNLGVLLIDAGRGADAVALYRRAIQRGHDDALLYFNLGVAYEDLCQPGQALDCYETSIHLAPQMADAHYNAARLHEQRGDARQAIHLYSEYRRLQR
jgi:hypothetical protein